MNIIGNRKVEDFYAICGSIDTGVAERMSYTCKLPLHINPGEGYFIEIGNTKPKVIGESSRFTIEDPIGILLECDVGVWCAGCGQTKHYVTAKKGYTGFSCTLNVILHLL